MGSENSKIPYIATAVWRACDGKPQRPGLDLTSLTEQQKEEWRKNTDGIVAKWSTVHEARHKKEREVEQEAVMRRAQEALNRAGGEPERTRDDFGNPLVKKEESSIRGQGRLNKRRKRRRRSLTNGVGSRLLQSG